MDKKGETFLASPQFLVINYCGNSIQKQCTYAVDKSAF
jgi:hypothetical protein